MTSFRRFVAGAVLAATWFTAGCSQTFDATNLGVPATMASPAGETPTGGQPFRVSTHTVHAFWGLLPLKKAQLDRSLANQLVGGKEVAQLRIKTKSRWTDLLITGLTLGVVAPKTVIYEGLIIGR